MTEGRATADIFTPIHKGIRSMIYALGTQLQTLDFADPGATEQLLAEIRVDFASSLGSNCVLCLLHAHAGSEEWGAFPQVAVHEPRLVEELIAEHESLTRRLHSISAHAGDILTLPSAEARLAAGIDFNREVNGFFAAYLAHMNREESSLVPAMQEHFTNEEIQSMRISVEQHMPRDRLWAYLTWMLPSLNASELTALFLGARRAAPPEIVELLTEIARTRVDPARWQTVSARLAR